MSLFGLKEKKEIERLRSQMQPEQVELADLQGKLEEKQKEFAELQSEVFSYRSELALLKEQIIETNEAILLQSYGLYTPRYNLMNSDEYKARLLAIRDKQKSMIKQGTATSGSQNWAVNNDKKKGKKMVSDMQKLLLRAFNSECDDVIEHVRYSNIDASEKRITSSREAISKLGTIMDIAITSEYYQLKIAELHLAFEYALKKQEEKEEQKELRAQMREEAKLAKELEEARKKLEKEQTHYQNALAVVNEQLTDASDEERAAVEEKKQELEAQLAKIDQEFKDVDYREANQKAGWVYIISNIGAFGENVYKIGMTRRTEPMERIEELSDASVPFNFDVHAKIFSADAPKLEAALHNAFADKRLNFVNTRREFFRVSLDEIKQVVKQNYDKTVEFIDVAPAEQYRQSVIMREMSQTANA